MTAASVEPLEVLTVGHSNLPCEQFIRIIQNAGVTAVADVRSAPYSHYTPHFNREAFRDRLRGSDISYVFLGHELGGRPRDSALFHQGAADYERMVAAPSFIAGLDRIVEGCTRFRIALMCSEHDPLDCHRCLLRTRFGRPAGDSDPYRVRWPADLPKTGRRHAPRIVWPGRRRPVRFL